MGYHILFDINNVKIKSTHSPSHSLIIYGKICDKNFNNSLFHTLFTKYSVFFILIICHHPGNRTPLLQYYLTVTSHALIKPAYFFSPFSPLTSIFNILLSNSTL